MKKISKMVYEAPFIEVVVCKDLCEEHPVKMSRYDFGDGTGGNTGEGDGDGDAKGYGWEDDLWSDFSFYDE